MKAEEPTPGWYYVGTILLLVLFAFLTGIAIGAALGWLLHQAGVL